MTQRRRARIAPVHTPHGPMWDAFDITRYLGTRCSRSVPARASAEGSGMLDRLMRLLAHKGIDKNPSEVQRTNNTLYLGPAAASEWVDQIVMTHGTSVKARRLQEKILTFARSGEPVAQRDTLTNTRAIVVPESTVIHARFDGQVWVHHESLTAALRGVPATTGTVREFEYLGEVSGWVPLTDAEEMVSSSQDTMGRFILSEVFSTMHAASEPEPEPELKPAPEPEPARAVELAPDSDPEPATEQPTDDDVKVLTVRAYIATVSPDPSVRKVYGIIIRNPGITRHELYMRLTSGVRKKLDDILVWLIASAGAAYTSGTRIYPILEHNGIRAAV